MKSWKKFLILMAIAISTGIQANVAPAMVFEKDKSTFRGTMGGEVGAAYHTLVTFGPSVDTYRAYDPGSGSFYNGGSAEQAGASMGYNGSYKVTQNASLGTDGLLMQVRITANTSASSRYVNYWDVTGSGYAEERVGVDLVFAGNQPSGYYTFSLLQHALDIDQVLRLGVNGVALSSALEVVTIQADNAGHIEFTAVLASASNASGISSSVSNVSDTIQFKLEPASVPEPAAVLFMAPLAVGLLCGSRKRSRST
jgi:hypothetical protein